MAISTYSALKLKRTVSLIVYAAERAQIERSDREPRVHTLRFDWNPNGTGRAFDPWAMDASIFDDEPTPNPDFAVVARDWDAANPSHPALAHEPYHDYVKAYSGGVWGHENTFAIRRSRYLIAKRKGLLHPNQEQFTTVDETFYVEDDPHPVDGRPTLFTNKDDAQIYCHQVFPSLPLSKVVEKIKRIRLFAFTGPT